MLGRLLLLLILLPAIEIVLLVWIATKTSLLFVLGLLLGAGLLGAYLSRQQGLRAMTRISQEVQAGRMPAAAMFDAMLVSLAALLLILPGVLSDIAALWLLFPPTRRLFKAYLRRRVETRVVAMHQAGFDTDTRRDEIIDVKVIESPPGPIHGRR